MQTENLNYKDTGQDMAFPYLYGESAGQYAFYRVPKLLFTSQRFAGISFEAKILYGLMLDRVSLSIKNGWQDEKNRSYIVFCIDEIMELMCCRSQKAVKLLGELEKAGLVEKRRRAGKASILYVKKFIQQYIDPELENAEDEVAFDYFYTCDAEQYAFYRVPKLLFTDPAFQISCEAKVLYGLMLDRAELSAKNGWMDELGRTYIVFRLDEIAELLSCGLQKATKLMREVCSFGLAEKRRQGFGRPNLLYVCNFVPAALPEESNGQEEHCEHAKILPIGEAGSAKNDENQNCENHDSVRMMKIKKVNQGDSEETTAKVTQISGENQEKKGSAGYTEQSGTCAVDRKSLPENDENQNTGSLISANLDRRKSKRNNTERNKTEKRETEKINPSIYLSDGSSQSRDGEEDGENSLSETRAKVCYDVLVHDNPECREIVDDLISLIAEVFRRPAEGTLRIGQEILPAREVQSRYRELTQQHLQYVLWSFETAGRESQIRNIKAYLLAMLYNAPVTMHSHYYAQYLHGLYHPD